MNNIIRNKNINKLKIAITTACNLTCEYCFVKKTNRDMDFVTAKKAIDLLIKSKGNDKMLSIYGGEPLLNFKLIEKMIPYAKALSRKKKKELTINICSNLSFLSKGHLDFFKENEVCLVTSLVGKEKYHDAYRKYGEKGSFRDLIAKIKLASKVLPLEKRGVSFCIFPSTVKYMNENFSYLLKLGFNYVNFEIIRQYEEWTLESVKLFYYNLRKIIDITINSVKSSRCIYLNPINWEIRHETFSKFRCPFNYEVEAYPDGELAFSPFLLNDKNKNKYIYGDLNKAFFRFRNCSFSPEKDICQRCETEYFSEYRNEKYASMVNRVYRQLCLEASNFLRCRKTDKFFSKYLAQINNKICF